MLRKNPYWGRPANPDLTPKMECPEMLAEMPAVKQIEPEDMVGGILENTKRFEPEDM